MSLIVPHTTYVYKGAARIAASAAYRCNWLALVNIYLRKLMPLASHLLCHSRMYFIASDELDHGMIQI